MNRILISLIVMLALSSAVFASWIPMNPNIPFGDFGDDYVVNFITVNEHLFYRAEFYTLFRSTDGINWDTIPTPFLVNRQIKRVVYENNTLFVITGSQLSYLHLGYYSTNQGASWAAFSLLPGPAQPSVPRLYTMAYNPADHNFYGIFRVGTQKKFAFSTNGYQWTIQNNAPSSILNFYIAPNGRFFFVTAQGLFSTTTWNIFSADIGLGNPNFSNTEYIMPDMVNYTLAFTDSSVIFPSMNGVKEFRYATQSLHSVILPAIQNSVTAICISKGNDWFVGTAFNGIFKIPGGVGTPVPFNDGLPLSHNEFDVICSIAPTGDYLFAGNWSGLGYTTRPRPLNLPIGNIWTSLSDSLLMTNSNFVWSLYTTGDQNITAGTWGGKVYQSNDSGHTWRNITGNIYTGYIWAVLRDEARNYVYAACERGVFRSDNDGASWTQTALPWDVRGLTKNSHGVLFATTWGRGNFRSADFGASWQPINEGMPPQLIGSCITAQRDTLYVGTMGGGLLRSVDNGDSWQTMPLPYLYIWSVGANADSVIIAGTYGDGAYRSFNAGASWSKDHMVGLSGSHFYQVVGVGHTLAMAGWVNNIYASYDAGNHWLTSLAMVGVDDVSPVPTMEQLASGHFPIRTAAIGSDKSKLPTSLELLQNYPNPFNPTTTISFNLPSSSNVSVKVYNTQGQIIETIVNRNLPAGNHSFEFDGSKLSSGVYFCRMQADGFSTVRKMTLQK